MNIKPFRFTVEDLPELDAKTRNGLQPLLDALNSTMQQLIAAAQAPLLSEVSGGTFVTDAGGKAYVTIRPRGIVQQVSGVTLDNITRKDGEDIDAVYSMSWTRQAYGVRLLFVGLDPALTYNFQVTLK